MPKPFKPTRPFPLPPDAEVVLKDGRPHARVRERGKCAVLPLTADGTQFLKPAAKWCADVRLADGSRKRFRFSPSRDASALMLADLLKRIENEKAGLVDRTADHRKRPLSEHVADWRAALRSAGRGEDYVSLRVGRVEAAVDRCGFRFTPDLSQDRLDALLCRMREGGLSVQTTNHWLAAVRQFCRWMADNGRLAGDPFARL